MCPASQTNKQTLHFWTKSDIVRLNISLSRAEANGHPELASQKVAALLSELLHLLSWAIVSPSPVEKNRFCISDVSRVSPTIRIVLFSSYVKHCMYVFLFSIETVSSYNGSCCTMFFIVRRLRPGHTGRHHGHSKDKRPFDVWICSCLRTHKKGEL